MMNRERSLNIQAKMKEQILYHREQERKFLAFSKSTVLPDSVKEKSAKTAADHNIHARINDRHFQMYYIWKVYPTYYLRGHSKFFTSRTTRI